MLNIFRCAEGKCNIITFALWLAVQRKGCTTSGSSKNRHGIDSCILGTN